MFVTLYRLCAPASLIRDPWQPNVCERNPIQRIRHTNDRKMSSIFGIGQIHVLR
jgi:hypothetical protein